MSQMVSSGNVYTVLNIVGFKHVSASGGYAVYECSANGIETEYIVVGVETDVTEDDLIKALETAGVPRDQIIDALHQCGL